MLIVALTTVIELTKVTVMKTFNKIRKILFIGACACLVILSFNFDISVRLKRIEDTQVNEKKHNKLTE